MALPIELRDFLTHGVRLISPHDPTFASRARPRIGASADVVLKEMAPCIALVANESSKTVVAMQTAWAFSGIFGLTDWHYSHHRFPDGVFDLGLERWSPAHVPIPPGGERVVARGVEVEQWLSQHNDSLRPFGADIRREARAGQLLRIELAGVIFNDGQMLGEGHGSFVRYFEADIAARRAAFVRALAALDQGTPADEVIVNSGPAEVAFDVRAVLKLGREEAAERLRRAIQRPFAVRPSARRSNLGGI